MNKLSIEQRAKIIGMLVEGNSLRSVTRMAGCSINTVTKLLADVGSACSEYQDKALMNLPCKRIQVDEIWSFCYSKQKNVGATKNEVEGSGSIWTWTSICADTKLVPSWMVGRRDAPTAKLFMEDLSRRLQHRVQLTSDGYKQYVDAVDDAFGLDIDYAMLVKLYSDDENQEKVGGRNPYVGAVKTAITGNPDMNEVSTSYVERQNLSMRMGIRRFTRKTNAFSKKMENHAHAISLHFIYYNFGRIHKTLRVTPAMEAGISDHVWSLEEIAALVKEEPAKKRGSYKKKISN